jgi:hypothetical protein
MKYRLIDGPRAGDVIDLPGPPLHTIRVPWTHGQRGYSIALYHRLRRWHPPLLAPETVFSVDPTRYYR